MSEELADPAVSQRAFDRRLERALRPRRRLAAEITQFVYLVGGVALGLLVPLAPLQYELSSADIRAMLFAIGGGIVALISVIFSLLFLVVQWGSSAFSPRLALFRDDPTVWHGFGYFLGMFAYCTVAALRIGNDATVPALVPVLALVMVVVAVVLIRRLQFRAFRSIQLSAVLNDLDIRGRAVLDAINTDAWTANAPGIDGSIPNDPKSHARRTIRWRGRPVVLQRLSLASLTDTAQSGNALIVLNVAVGETVQEGAAIATVIGDTGRVVQDAAVLEAIDTGAERSFDQDPLFAFRLIVDIALRAQSSAINDQATTVQCLDVLEGLLRHLAHRQLDIGRIHAADGALRVVLTIPRWRDYLAESLDDLILAAGQSPMVLVRIRRLLIDLLSVVPEQRQPPLHRRLDLVEQRLQQHFPLAWQHLQSKQADAEAGR